MTFTLVELVDITLLVAIACLWFMHRQSKYSMGVVDIEYIAGVAIKDINGKIYQLPKPYTHSDILLQYFSEHHTPMVEKEQGFYTDHGRYVDRKQAFKIASASGQILDLSKAKNGILTVEDVWPISTSTC